MSTIHHVFKSDSSHLSRLANLDENAQDIWQPEELGDILRHQLNAPLAFDLTTREPRTQTVLDAVHATVAQPPRKFGDLFHHPHPPLDLLKLAKDFAKAHRNSPNSPLPHEIATVLYFASILVALSRHRQRITTLDNPSIRQGIEWVLNQTWVDDATRALFREGVKQLGDDGGHP